jgi:cytochrome c oxidase subunit II
MAEPQAPAASTRKPERRHGWVIFWIWLPLALAADLIIWFVWKPHMPPGDMASAASDQQFDITVLAVCAAPVILFIWIFAAYAFVTWRHREGDDTDGPPIQHNVKIQATWIGATAVIVLGLFVFGTYELIAPAGAGAGEGPSPIWKPSSSNMLQVQVIGQQWQFTYRYPQFGGIETTQLVLPDNRTVAFNVTSIDVIHSFWAYRLGVKADANPGVNNVAYTTTKQLGSFMVRCNELCGLWHGAMFNSGRVITPSAFEAWAKGEQAAQARSGLLAALPPFQLTYDPNVIPQLNTALVKMLGSTGAVGFYYPTTDPIQP